MLMISGLAFSPKVSVTRHRCQKPVAARSQRRCILVTAQKGERSEVPHERNEAISGMNTSSDCNKRSAHAGSQDVDTSPKGGAGVEPKQVDGEGQGYSMEDIAKQGSSRQAEEGEQQHKGDCRCAERKASAVGEEAGVQDVE